MIFLRPIHKDVDEQVLVKIYPGDLAFNGR